MINMAVETMVGTAKKEAKFLAGVAVGAGVTLVVTNRKTIAKKAKKLAPKKHAKHDENVMEVKFVTNEEQ